MRSLGVPLKTERGNRVFPVSDSAFDISAALERRLKALRVQRPSGTGRSALEIEDGAVRGVAGERGRYPAEAVVLATGGVSYPGHRLHRRRSPDGSGGGTHRHAAAGVSGATCRGSSRRAFPVSACRDLSLRNVEPDGI